jgi:hypothetical protein
MSSRSAKPSSYTSSIYGSAVTAWHPFEIALRWNSLTFAAYSTLGQEAQNFLARRINEDVLQARRLAHCRAPHDVMAAYTDFWRKAAEDYGKEASTLAMLMINAASKMVVVGQFAMDEEKIQPASLREAAE